MQATYRARALGREAPALVGHLAIAKLRLTIQHMCRYTYPLPIMRTNIIIDDRLMEETLRATGLKTKKEAVDAALRILLRVSEQERIRHLRDKVDWQGDLEVMRADL